MEGFLGFWGDIHIGTLGIIIMSHPQTFSPVFEYALGKRVRSVVTHWGW